MIDQLVIETIQYACKSVRMDERAFVESIRSASEIREQSEAKKLKAALKHQEKRYAELDILLKKVYEDNALGRLPDKRYEMLSAGYEKEQAEPLSCRSACSFIMIFLHMTGSTAWLIYHLSNLLFFSFPDKQ